MKQTQKNNRFISANQLKVYENISDLIASPANPTPMVKLNERLNPFKKFSIYLKLERYNPFGSIKDRIALSMLNDYNNIKKGFTIIEPSSGNTGIALASIANARNIPVEIAVPRGIPEEKKTLLRLLGVKILWEADDELCPQYPNEGARGLVNGIIKSEGVSKYINPDQYENMLNVQAHYNTTGPEIWNQTEGKIDYFFAALGTCGTISGVGKYLKEKNSSIKIIGVEPKNSVHKLPGMKRLTNLREDLIPKILDRNVIDEIVDVDDDTAYKTGIKVARRTGILVGPTTGAIISVALDYAKINSGIAVCISPDDAFKYASLYHPHVKDDGKLTL
ncbi:MAG: PLP-dependent cysteine synthase family protein [Promethearchaeota archaeon]|jgi:cysteine synthase A/cysteine synthase B